MAFADLHQRIANSRRDVLKTFAVGWPIVRILKVLEQSMLFPKLLKILKRKDNLSTYYLNIPGIESKFPLMAAENTLLRDKKGFLLVDRMEEKELADDLFSIPDGFEKVER